VTVGFQLSQQQINQQAGQLATGLRDWARGAGDFHTAIDALGADDTARATALTALGFTSDDATELVYLANVINTVAAVYYGTAAQTPPFSFDSALSPLWGAR
jgi:alkylhydroperoxidase family enzyme